MDWLKIVSALFIAAMLVFLYPRMRDASKNAPKGTREDWMGAIKPLIMVVVFVIILIMLVQ